MTSTIFARDAQGRAKIQRPELLLWAAIFLFANSLVAALVEPHDLGLGWGWVLRSRFGIFDALAWGVAIWRLTKAVAKPPRSGEIPFLLCICLLGALRSQTATELAVSGLAGWLFFDNEIDVRASAAILVGIASHQLWSRIVFEVFSAEFVKIDAFMVGQLVTLTVKGAAWSDNIISVPGGHSIAVLEGCSSFSNVSTSLLAWVALAKLERARWVPRDLWVALATIIAQVTLNVARLYLIARSPSLFAYWHEGQGVQIYTALGTVAAVFIGALGTRWATRRT
jgi:exosortase/archaeosortase family protein